MLWISNESSTGNPAVSVFYVPTFSLFVNMILYTLPETNIQGHPPQKRSFELTTLCFLLGAVAVRFRDAIYLYRQSLRFGAEEKHTQSPNEVTQQEEKDQSLLLRETKKWRKRFPLNSTDKVYGDSYHIQFFLVNWKKTHEQVCRES